MMNTLSSATFSGARPFLALFNVGWETSRRDKVTRVALASLYVGLVVILSGLYRMTPFEKFSGSAELSYETVVWYMAITELMAIAVWTQYREVREEVLNHHISGLMVMPVSYYWLKTGEWFGRTTENMIRFAIIGTLVALFLTRTLPIAPQDIPALLLSLLFAAMIFNNLHFLVGITEVWGAHSRPVFLIVQKLLFVLGGLLMPLEIYPVWLQKLAWATPYPAILYGPGSFALGKSGGQIGALLAIQIFWIAVTGALALFVLSAARRKIGRDGD